MRISGIDNRLNESSDCPTARLAMWDKRLLNAFAGRSDLLANSHKANPGNDHEPSLGMFGSKELHSN